MSKINAFLHKVLALKCVHMCVGLLRYVVQTSEFGKVRTFVFIMCCCIVKRRFKMAYSCQSCKQDSMDCIIGHIIHS